MQSCGHLGNRGHLCLSVPLSKAKTSLFLVCHFPNQKGRKHGAAADTTGACQEKGAGGVNSGNLKLKYYDFWRKIYELLVVFHQ